MDGTMDGSSEQKRGNLHLERGGLADQPLARDRHGPRRHESPDQWFDREVRNLFVTWKADGGEGPYASRQIADVAQNIRHPHRIIARRMREARRKRVKAERVRRLGELFIELADRLYARPMDLDPAA